jgi:S1-C subfamily serine protease
LGEKFVRGLGFLFALVLALLIGGTASAQEGKGWLGADVQDVTKAEADKLGWDTPHGVKLGVFAAGSPADRAGLKTGDIILAIDATFIETGSNVEVLVAAKHAGDELRLQVLSEGRERRINVMLSERPKIEAVQDQGGPLLCSTP